jgi:hypothetical protein
MLKNIVISVFWRIVVSAAIAESLLLVVPLLLAGAIPLLHLLRFQWLAQVYTEMLGGLCSNQRKQSRVGSRLKFNPAEMLNSSFRRDPTGILLGRGTTQTSFPSMAALSVLSRLRSREIMNY